MSLSYKDSIAANNVIAQIVDADKKERIVFHAPTRLHFARILHETKPAVEAYSKEHEVLVRRLGVAHGVDITVTPENMAEFISQNNAMLAKDTGLTLATLSHKDIGENQIPIDLLSTLFDIGILK